MHGWNNVFGKCVVDTYQEEENPMPSVLNNMRISYKFGGFFQIKRVKWDTDGQMFLDYSILVDSVTDAKQYEILQQLHEQ